MTRYTASVAGFAFAPLISAVVCSVLTPIPGARLSGFNMLSLFYICAFVITVVAAVPTYLVLLRFRLVTCWSIVASGAVIGALVGLVLLAPNPMQSHGIVVTALTGALSACGFWTIWRLGR